MRQLQLTKACCITLFVLFLLLLPGCTALSGPSTPAVTTPPESQPPASTQQTSTPENESGSSGIGHNALRYPVIDTGQSACFDAQGAEIACHTDGAIRGQDAQHVGFQPSFTDNGDGTITDNVTRLTWQQRPDTNGDGSIDAKDKFVVTAAEAYCRSLSLAGYDDWRLPTIKELYSLIDFNGIDPSGYQGTDTESLVPFIDTDYFAFRYGDIDAGERIIDAQFASSTMYVAETNNQTGTMVFGVNFADGRIKGYGLTLPGGEKTFYVLAVRGETAYGTNDFHDNGDGTITDRATGLMWSQSDSGENLNWEQALELVQKRNAEGYLGYHDWRLPNAKELQSIVDYSRSPDTSGSAALDPLFAASVIINEAGQEDYAWYWSSTTHANFTQYPGHNAAYVAFGRAMGYMHGRWLDVHGAGAQRSDPKVGDPAQYPTGHGPQGDAIRIYSHVRLVRDST